MLIVGIDPGTGLRSALGIVIFNPKTKSILFGKSINANGWKSPRHRIRYISGEVEKIIREYSKSTKQNIKVFIESTVMRGKGGETLQRCIGAIESKLPYSLTVEEIGNKTVKKKVAGHGNAEKLAVAQGVGSWFGTHKESKYVIDRLTKESQWDVLDAFAIAIAGHENGN